MNDDLGQAPATIDAGGPFGFALTDKGALLLSFRLQGFPVQIVVPSAELEKLQHLLGATETIRGMLGVKPPEQGGH